MRSAFALRMVLCLGLFLSAAQTQAADASSEEGVIAAYLFKLRNYVEWPPGLSLTANRAYVIGLIGADGIADDLQKMAATGNPNKDPFTVRKLHHGDALDGVHLLFVGAPAWGRELPMRNQARARGVLLASQIEDALAQGSMINFVVLDERVRFEISLDAAEKSGLKISARLLTLATNVVKERR